jgi:hypothetical protein
MSESPNNQAILRKAPPAVSRTIEPTEKDRAFGLAVYSALRLLANAFYRRYVGDLPKDASAKNN